MICKNRQKITKKLNIFQFIFHVDVCTYRYISKDIFTKMWHDFNVIMITYDDLSVQELDI